MKLGIVYTSTTPELIECVNEEIRKNLGDTPEILNYQDPSILAEVREHGYVTAGAAARLVGMYMQAVSDGADAILTCHIFSDLFVHCKLLLFCWRSCRCRTEYWTLHRHPDCSY